METNPEPNPTMHYQYPDQRKRWCVGMKAELSQSVGEIAFFGSKRAPSKEKILSSRLQCVRHQEVSQRHRLAGSPGA